MDPSSYKEIRYEIEDGRARITLTRPDKHNAITSQLLEELEHALWEADEDLSVHCVILRGEGASFCSGYDLMALGGKKREGHRTGRSHDDDIWLIEQGNRRIRALWEMHKPSIAQVHGSCLAGGTDLAMACDIVIAAEDARIGFPAGRAMGALPLEVGRHPFLQIDGFAYIYNFPVGRFHQVDAGTVANGANDPSKVV